MLQAPIIVDGHIDTPQRMLDARADVSARLPDGHIDIPRMQAGGLSAAFFSIWVSDSYGPGTAFRRALALIGAVRQLADTNPAVELATTAEEVRAAAGMWRPSWGSRAATRSKTPSPISTASTTWVCGT